MHSFRFMKDTGAKAELVKEMRRIGAPRVADAARNLDLSVRVDGTMPAEQFALDMLEGRIWGGTEEAVWAGIAHFLALEMALDADLSVLWEAVAAIGRRSGVFRQIA